MVQAKKVTILFDLDKMIETTYGRVESLIDDNHRYDILWMDSHLPSASMNSGNEDNLTPEKLLEKVRLCGKFEDLVTIKSKTRRLARVSHRQSTFEEPLALVHIDKRRTIYDPSKILDGLRGKWYPHNLISINDSSSILGNHHHDYKEAFFVPGGNIEFVLVDPEEPRNPQTCQVSYGGRLLIPPYIDHTIKGKKGSILLGYGSVPYDPKRSFSSEKKVLDTLLSQLE